MAEGLRDLTKLDHVYPALASLHLGHKALRLAQPICEINLSDARSLPR